MSDPSTIDFTVAPGSRRGRGKVFLDYEVRLEREGTRAPRAHQPGRALAMTAVEHPLERPGFELQDMPGPSALGGGWARFRRLVWRMSRTELATRYHNSVLGYLWTLLAPLLLFVVLTSHHAGRAVRRRDRALRESAALQHYALHLYAECTSRSIACLVSKAEVTCRAHVPEARHPTVDCAHQPVLVLLLPLLSRRVRTRYRSPALLDVAASPVCGLGGLHVRCRLRLVRLGALRALSGHSVDLDGGGPRQLLRVAGPVSCRALSREVSFHALPQSARAGAHRRARVDIRPERAHVRRGTGGIDLLPRPRAADSGSAPWASGTSSGERRRSRRSYSRDRSAPGPGRLASEPRRAGCGTEARPWRCAATAGPAAVALLRPASRRFPAGVGGAPPAIQPAANGERSSAITLQGPTPRAAEETIAAHEQDAGQERRTAVLVESRPCASGGRKVRVRAGNPQLFAQSPSTRRAARRALVTERRARAGRSRTAADLRTRARRS